MIKCSFKNSLSFCAFVIVRRCEVPVVSPLLLLIVGARIGHSGVLRKLCERNYMQASAVPREVLPWSLDGGIEDNHVLGGSIIEAVQKSRMLGCTHPVGGPRGAGGHGSGRSQCTNVYLRQKCSIWKQRAEKTC